MIFALQVYFRICHLGCTKKLEGKRTKFYIDVNLLCKNMPEGKRQLVFE
jgi:hypothetical protein